MIRSVGSQAEILQSIVKLHCPQGIDCDVTYGHGKFYEHVPPPRLKFDIEPMVDGVTPACSTTLPVADGTLTSMMFDPPFLTYVRAGRDGNGSMTMARRFGGYWRYDELLAHYHGTIMEARRVLTLGGKLIVKCQDIIHNHRMHCTHLNVVRFCELNGFRLLDLFVCPSNSRMKVTPSNGKAGNQKHARIHHSYFLVLVRVSFPPTPA